MYCWSFVIICQNVYFFSFSKTYQLLDFENSANYKNIQAEKILDRFFG